METDLTSELARFQHTLEELAPSTAASLADPVRAEVLDDLRRALGLDTVPGDLTTLFRWHNGQVPGAPPVQGNRVLLSVESAIGAWRFLNDPDEDHPNPVDKNWFPILFNGAGDYVVFHTATQELLDYWHDESSTRVTCANLATWVVSTIAAIPATTPALHDGLLDALKETPANFLALVQADVSSIDASTLRDLRALLQLPLVEMKRLTARPDAQILSIRLGDTAARRTVRDVILLLDKKGRAPRVTLSRDADKQIEIPTRAFVSALPF